MAFRMARRLIGGGWYGVLAGVCAALALFSSNKYVRDAALGNSEALLAALVLWAFERHLDGRRDHALYLGVRWPRCCAPRCGRSSACTGSGCGSRSRELRARLVAFGALDPGALVPARVVGLGRPASAPARAPTTPTRAAPRSPTSPRSSCSAASRKVTIAPVELGTLIAVGYAAVMWVRRRGARRRPSPWPLGGLAWFVLVAAMTEAGFAGNQRYLIVTTAAVCVLGGMGAVRVLQGVEWLGARAASAAPARGRDHGRRRVLSSSLVASPLIVEKADNTGARARRARARGPALARPQGPDRRGRRAGALLACGSIYSGPFQTQMVAYELGIHGIDVGWRPRPRRGSVFRTRTVPDGPLVTKPTDDRFRLVGTNGKWRLLTVPPDGRSDCRGQPVAPTADAPERHDRTPPLEVIGDPDARRLAGDAAATH